MIIGKINPVIKLAKQVDNFTYSEVTGSCIVAFARRYKLGDEKAEFEVLFGNIVENENKNSFEVLTRNNVALSGADIANWGTDDSIVLSKLAELSGTTATQFVTGSFKNLDF